jgi:N-acetylmuramoyl-L-alanine amidase
MMEERLKEMNKQFRIIILCVMALLMGTVFPSGTIFQSTAEAFSKATLKVGSKGGDVYELQGRLKHLGYYKGKIDGHFGWGTYKSVKTFQWKFGLKTDGVVGSTTKLKLWRATKAWAPGKTSQAASGGAVLKKGSSGGNVYDLQGRLKFLGFYKGKIDGSYGSRTAASVRRFQSQFGLKVDGVAGSNTVSKLRAATKNYKPGAGGGGGTQAKSKTKYTTNHSHRGFSSQDISLMANAVYGEARGEPYTGQVAVAAVILNRIDNAKFPNTISGVIFQPGAFTAVADGQIYLTPNERAKKAVQDAINGWDPTGGCIYYFNPVTATSKWIWSRPQVKKIGKHIFCK